ncbi:ABC transporter ATP-binding protein [Globicatella sp. PHS-GS-PNBC-21-1553]|uniref:ABC transporter ATP-binding protein n=1 Tax=Globicatella sp. PHS-GS-PNBC-21-1553 TaxID=2885764 RepID=UPI00298EDD7D|nr:ABC transporter ATP-binding protein [Globicatella sp. PHS-GS-PNBC-21-1553]WPC08111.1 ABC transporter ATP-binding protein [Globicatella sp. PHS-GS-PNBC-21-1553]
MGQAIVEVKNVAKHYKKKQVLKDVTFEVYPGEIIALLGENGAGKSTLINIINQLISANQGEVTLFGGKIKHQLVKEKTGIMLQNNILLKKLNVSEVLELTRSYYGAALPYKELVEIANLNELEYQEMTKLSGGQQRRLSFATAIAGNPDLLFLDEPTANMDARSRQNLWQEVGKLKDQGKTIIVTSHHLEELEDIASRLLILQDGVIAFDGSIQELRATQGQGTIEFDSQRTQEDFSGIQPLIQLTKQGNHYTLITQDVTEIIKQLVDYFDDITNLSVRQTTLETLFSHFRKEKGHE